MPAHAAQYLAAADWVLHLQCCGMFTGVVFPTKLMEKDFYKDLEKIKTIGSTYMAAVGLAPTAGPRVSPIQGRMLRVGPGFWVMPTPCQCPLCVLGSAYTGSLSPLSPGQCPCQAREPLEGPGLLRQWPALSRQTDPRAVYMEGRPQGLIHLNAPSLCRCYTDVLTHIHT